MNPKKILLVYLGIMTALLGVALANPRLVTAALDHPRWYLHAKFVHVLSVTIFFGNVVLGTIWEARALASANAQTIRFVYRTVILLDAVLTAPLVILALLSGLMLANLYGGVWHPPWLALAFSIFLASGIVWVILDIPSQYLTNKILHALSEHDTNAPDRLTKLLRLRVYLNVFTIVPLVVIFYLMVLKPA